MTPSPAAVETLVESTEVPAPVDRAALTEHLAVLGTLLLVIWPVAAGGGGRDPGRASWLALATIAAVLTTRPWARLSGRAWLLAPLVAAAALLVLPLTGAGRAGSVAALGYVDAAGLVVAVAAYARTPGRRATVAALICAGGVAEFAWALVPWWGGAVASHPMVGTYYWHNQLAVALLLPALLGASLAVAGRRPWRSAGWIAAPLSVAGLVLSTSRATLLCLLGGWVVVIGLAVFAAPKRRKAGVRAIVVTLLAVGVTFILPGPPLFPTYTSPFGGTVTRAAAGETLQNNTAYRTQFWREALIVTRAHPLAGVGYGRLAEQATPLVPKTWARSPLAHSGPLQALADGGLVLALPFFLALGAIGIGLLRPLRPRSRGGPDQALVAGASVAALALIAHSLVDADWTYAALAAQFAIVVGLVLAARPAGSEAAPADANPADAVEPAEVGAVPPRVVALVGTAVLVGALGIGAFVGWGQFFHIANVTSVAGEAHS